MLTFKEYLTEIFDKPHPFLQTKRINHGHATETIYQFQTPDKKKFHVHLTHDHKTNSTDVGFADEHGNLNATGSMGRAAHGVITTVGHIVRHYLHKNPDVGSVTYSGLNTSGKETGRLKLYTGITNKFGGSTKTDNKYFSSHTIPADNIRKVA